MSIPKHLRNFGEEVSICDKRGRIEARGKIVGIYRIHPPIYDVLVNGELMKAITDERIINFVQSPK